MTSSRRPFRNADLKLKMLEERLKLGTWIFDSEGSEAIWSDGLFRLLGMDPGAVVPTIDLLMSLMHPDDRLGHATTAELVTDPRIRNRRFRLIRPDGRLLHIQNHAEPHFDRNGRLSFLVGVAVDVTDEENLQLRLREQQQVTEIIDELGAGHIWRADRHGKLKDVRHWGELTGQSHEDARDWSKLSAIHPDDRATFRAAWEKAINTRSEYRSTVRVRNAAGQYLTVVGRGMPAKLVDGEITEWLGFSQIIGPSLSDRNDLKPAQIRAARALLDWSAQELADRAGVSFSTLRRMEKSTDTIQENMIAKVRAVLMENGILLYDDGRGRIGATLA